MSHAKPLCQLRTPRKAYKPRSGTTLPDSRTTALDALHGPENDLHDASPVLTDLGLCAWLSDHGADLPTYRLS